MSPTACRSGREDSEAAGAARVGTRTHRHTTPSAARCRLAPRGRDARARPTERRCPAGGPRARPHRRLIQIHALSGDRSAAQRQFERCSAILDRELGVSPLPETRAVYEAALSGALRAENEQLRSAPDITQEPELPILNSQSSRSEHMARAGREIITLQCTECKNRNYTSNKNKKNCSNKCRNK